MNIILLLLLASITMCGDAIEGVWDFASEEAKGLKLSDSRAFILEGMPAKTFLEFKNGLHSLYRNDKLIYQMPYKVVKVKDSLIEIEVGPTGMARMVYLYVLDGVMHARVMGLRDIEYVYKRRG